MGAERLRAFFMEHGWSIHMDDRPGQPADPFEDLTASELYRKAFDETYDAHGGNINSLRRAEGVTDTFERQVPGDHDGYHASWTSVPVEPNKPEVTIFGSRWKISIGLPAGHTYQEMSHATFGLLDRIANAQETPSEIGLLDRIADSLERLVALTEHAEEDRHDKEAADRGR